MRAFFYKSDWLLVCQNLVGLGHFLEDASVLLGNDSLDDQQGGDHQSNGDDQADHHVLDQAGQDEADEGHTGDGQSVGAAAVCGLL